MCLHCWQVIIILLFRYTRSNTANSQDVNTFGGVSASTSRGVPHVPGGWNKCRIHRSCLLGILLYIEGCCLKWQLEPILLPVPFAVGFSFMVSLFSRVCWPHTGASLALLLCLCCKGWLDLEERWGSLYCSCCSGKRDAEAWHDCLVWVWHQGSIWAVQSRLRWILLWCSTS